ncbi:MAG: immunity 50 family protein [Polyangiaceae bacterium]|nr:immunity 50 family protein [Polyangiaceae bacterium]
MNLRKNNGDWIELVAHNRFLRALYGDRLGEAATGSLVGHHYDALSNDFILTIDLDLFPVSPPPKWHGDANTVQLQMMFFDLSKLSVGVKEGGRGGRLSICRREPQGVSFAFGSDSTEVSGEAGGASVVKISAYQDDLLPEK